MRTRMRSEFAKKPSSERSKLSFIIKHSLGGIVDIEFMVQYLVLANCAAHPELLSYPDNVRILEAARAAELLDAEEHDLLTEAYLGLRSALHRFALAQMEQGELPEELAQLQAGVERVWQRLFPSTEAS